MFSLLKNKLEKVRKDEKMSCPNHKEKIRINHGMIYKVNGDLYEAWYNYYDPHILHSFVTNRKYFLI